MSRNDSLKKLLRELNNRPLPTGITALAEAARQRHPGVAAVLFYGSCLRTGRADEGLADLYLLVDDYRKAFGSRYKAFLNHLLPPNVFYLETVHAGKILRCKYAVLTLKDFRKGASRWFHSYLWARFAQPTGLVFVRSADTEALIQEAWAEAVRTFIRHTLPQAPAIFSARDLWTMGLSLTYRCELRSEGPATAARLVDAAVDFYVAVTHETLHENIIPVNILPGDGRPRYMHDLSRWRKTVNALAWRARQVQGKILSVLRLLKGLLTFENGLDYILWKIERHSGIRVEVGHKLRRFPLLAVPVTFWRLFRKGGFR